MPRNPEQAQKRRQEIARLLMTEKNVSSAELAQRFGVNQMTIRRDLAALAESGVALRSYGGAVAAQRIELELAFDERRRQHLAEKAAIGAAAAERVETGQTLFLDTGTTTLEMARALLTRDVRCHILTYSLAIAAALWGRGHVELSLLGGRVRQGSPDLAGPLTEWMLEKVSADVAFVGSDGLDLSRGSFAGDMEAARVVERMVANAQRVIVLADSSKLGHAGAARYAQISQIDELITDRNAPPALVRDLRQAGVRVETV